MNVPILKLEFESMKHSLRMMIDKHMMSLDSDIQAAIDQFCKPENLQYLIDQEVKQAITFVVKEEIQNQFKYSGPGRAAIREAVQEHMNEYWGDRNEQK